MNTQDKRKKNIKMKFNVVKNLIFDKNIIIVDDSIVRGNTLKNIINLLKKNNVKKIYIASGCPKILNKNIYGIDIPNKKDLICEQKNDKELMEYFGVDNIIFQDIDDLKKSIQFFNKNITNFELSVFNCDA
tara:strand:- start:210 stop:602 length:393 start_codon:yes stop_codon:yes gene_type:complete